MPVKGRRHAVDLVVDIDDHDIVLANLNGWTGQLSIDCKESSLDSVSHYAILVEAVALVALVAVVACAAEDVVELQGELEVANFSIVFGALSRTKVTWDCASHQINFGLFHERMKEGVWK